MKLIHGRRIALWPDFVEPRFWRDWINYLGLFCKILSVWFSSQSWFNKAPPKVWSAGSMAALEKMFHYIVHCRLWTLLLAGLALSRDAEQLLCHWWEQNFVFSRQGRPRIIRKFGEWRSSVLLMPQRRETLGTPSLGEVREELRGGISFKIANF